MFTYTVYHDNVQQAQFTDQHNDFKAFAYLLDHQSASSTHALKYEGWKITVTDQQTGQTVDYRTGKPIPTT